MPGQINTSRHMSTVHYLAYGSNLHPVRLNERVPSAKLVEAVELQEHCLTFHKKSNDGSGKCNLVNTGSEGDSVFGAIYTLDPRHRSVLDKFEGNGFGYLDNQITLQHQEQKYTCFTYLAQQSHIVENLKPYHWYKELVVLGAKFLRFPDSYVSSISSVESIEDSEENRKKQNEALIKKIIEFF